MIAIGGSMVTGGQAWIAAGMKTEKVGITTETVGNYGKAAANVTKTAVYASEGNITGALTSAGTAVMSGASAIKGTKEMQSGFQSVNKEGAKAAQKASDKAGAKAAEQASAAEAARAAGDTAKADKLAEKASDLNAKSAGFEGMSNDLQGKVDASNMNKLDKTIEKTQDKLNKTNNVDVDKFRDAEGKIDAAKAKAAGATNAQMSRINAENQLNSLQAAKDAAGNGDLSKLNEFAEASEKKFANKMDKAMQFGNFAMTAASQLGALNRTPSASGPQTRGHASAQYSNRRKIA